MTELPNTRESMVVVTGLKISAAELLAWTTDVLCKVGVPRSDARLVADNLVDANLKGIDSHGVMRLAAYVARLRRGGTNPAAVPRIAVDLDAFCVVDGDNGLGAVVATAALRIALERARTHGCAFIAVRNSSHFGAAGYYAERGARDGMLVLILSNAEATMAPAGGREAMFGTNPLAIAMPADLDGPIVFDMATSAGAQGKIISAAQHGSDIPPGWAIGPDGEPTTDPRRALEGLLLPFGGHKGSGLAFIIDLICGVIPGGAIGTEMPGMYRDPDKPQRVGHVIACIDLNRLDLARVGERAGARARRYAAAATQVGAPPLRWPGQRAAECRASREKDGIPLSALLLEDLDALGRAVGVPFDLRSI